MKEPLNVVMLGASGAVGGCVLDTLLQSAQVQKISVLARRSISGRVDSRIQQHIVDVMAPEIYASTLAGHSAAICTLGLGQPSKFSKQEFVRVDRDAVLAFARACKHAGVRHFELLGSVGANASSASFYLRTKGELVEGLKALRFERLSVFQPSMILTPTNHYGVSQAIVLATWPWLSPLLGGSLRKYRGVKVDQLGASIAKNLWTNRDIDLSGGNAAGENKSLPRVEVLHWSDIVRLAGASD
jgi:uncharacterized protein YbjT (DUF2867 family)